MPDLQKLLHNVLLGKEMPECMFSAPDTHFLAERQPIQENARRWLENIHAPIAPSSAKNKHGVFWTVYLPMVQ